MERASHVASHRITSRQMPVIATINVTTVTYTCQSSVFPTCHLMTVSLLGTSIPLNRLEHSYSRMGGCEMDL